MHSIESLAWPEFGQKTAGHQEEDDDETFVPGRGFARRDNGPWYVIPEKFVLRQLWGFVLAFLLVYTGTVFPYRLCFVSLRIGASADDDVTFWVVFDYVVDILFYIDLIAGFFFTYRCNKSGKEVFQIQKIVVNYLKTYFILNLVACIPPPLFQAVMELFQSDSDDSESGDFNKAARLSRLQRVSRLARLARIIRLAKIFNCKSNAVWIWFQSFRYIRIVNFVCGLFWVVHLVACGWYLCAWFHENPEDTWVYRRGILDSPPVDQWVHAQYFVLTVFTTVGFGDMSASTLGEIFYVSFTMIVGAIVHSIVMSEVIGILMSADQNATDMKAQKDLVKSFTDHVKLDNVLSQELMTFFEYNRSRRRQIDREKIKNLLTSSVLPRELMELLASGLFEGELEHNKFITTCHGWETRLPVRFPLLLALALNERNYARKEMVYCAYDHPWNIFLVVKGTFAYVAFPSRSGGLADLPADYLEGITNASATTGAGASLAHTLTTMWTKNKSVSSSSTATKKIPTSAEVMKNRTEAVKNAGNKHGALFPYQLFGPRTYFGDLELMLKQARNRYSGSRSEVDGCQLLVLHKTDLIKLMQDFGRFGHAWRAKAKRREEQRRRNMARLRIGKPVETMAAETIQRVWRIQHGRPVNIDSGPSVGSDIFQMRESERRLSRASSEASTHARLSFMDRMGHNASHDEENPNDILHSLRQEMGNALQSLRHEIKDILKAKDTQYRPCRPSGMSSVSIVNYGSALELSPGLQVSSQNLSDGSFEENGDIADPRQVELEKEVVLL